MITAFLGIILFSFLILFPGCSKKKADAQISDRLSEPILIIGMDGMEWNLVLKLLQDRRLPEIAGLIRRGTYGVLETQRPTSSPILWTTIATGKRPAKHNIRNFIHEAQDGEPRRLYTNSDRKTKAFWNILSDYKKTVNCIGWWLTYPVEPIRGVMVAQTNTLKGRIAWKGALLPGVDGQVYPPERQAELMQIVMDTDRELPQLLKEMFGESTSEEHLGLVKKGAWAFRADAIYEKIAAKLAREKKIPDLTAVYFGGPDVVGHLFWQYMEPESKPPEHRPSPEDAKRWGHIIPDYYVRMDRAIGNLLRLYPTDTTVILLSDHGMTAEGHHKNPPPEAFFVAAGSKIQAINGKSPEDLNRLDLVKIGSIQDLTPTLLTLTGVPTGLDMDGEVMENILNASFRKLARPAPVATHDTPEWLASRPKIQTGMDEDSERMEQLKSLGYIN